LNFRPTFSKNERISAQKEIDFLFNEGDSFTISPLHIVYKEKKTVSEVPVSILVGIPKKRFKRAVKRNRIKRLIKEAYRLNKHELWNFLRAEEKGLLIAFVYIENKQLEYSKIESAVVKVLNELESKMQ
jgi:ribonuclease P protein component